MIIGYQIISGDLWFLPPIKLQNIDSMSLSNPKCDGFKAHPFHN